MQAAQQIASVGHNLPPSDIDIVKSRLEDVERPIRESIAHINQEPLPATIEDERTAGHVTERIKSLRNIKNGVDTAHKEIKAPYLECGRAVDAWKNGIETELEGMRKAAEIPLNGFLTRKAEEERQRQAEVARQQREEADRLAAEAAAHQAANINDVAEELLDAAVKSEATANRIEQNITNARPSDLAKSRSAYGSTSSQKMAWVGRIVSLRGIDLEVLRPYLNEEAVQKALNAFVKNGGRECGGATITEEITGLNIR